MFGLCSCKRDVCLDVCDALTHVKREHYEGKGGDVLWESRPVGNKSVIMVLERCS